MDISDMDIEVGAAARASFGELLSLERLPDACDHAYAADRGGGRPLGRGQACFTFPRQVSTELCTMVLRGLN